ncbi:MAG: NAD(P)/FAD-dependent oxidoreductase [Spirochaetales bacterium]|nr:NAD(P)/FAD-dependent oxidoreductase [Leptospiraceae bacterium]MCP5480151.1 NAD(P)/FAD-dependent oxidoreductase [Spirochaetales bacterium]MCP5485509.1 NAD(P)/FAD-dependent oxidoreductase [Spirochaetales bacterium]
MRDVDVLIIGGGPAGSSCAWALKTKHGRESLILDKTEFPRLKLCAGWITPLVVEQLELDPATYPHRFVTFDTIHAEYFGRKGVRRVSMKTTQHSIRRTEFDNWLLQRSGAEVIHHQVREIRRDGDHFIVDDQFRANHLVGAGGTHCPVFRTFFKDINPRSKEYQIGALEEEFEYDYEDPNCHLWFGENGLVGYSWYVPKGDGWVNVGIGGWSEHITTAPITLRDQWDFFTAKLKSMGLVRDHDFKPKGHTYYVRERAKVGQNGRAYIVGDAAGLATRDLAEGIGPAVESGLQAAASIVTGKPYRLKHMTKYSMFNRGLKTELLERFFDRRARLFSDRIWSRGRPAGVPTKSDREPEKVPAS